MFHDPATRPYVPRPVRLVAWFELISGLVFVVFALFLVRGTATAISLVSAAVALAAGWGLLNARLWAYYVVLALAGLNVVASLLTLLRGGTPLLFSLVLNGAIVFILLSGQSWRWAESLRRPS